MANDHSRTALRPVLSAALLALADQRLPSGGHVHSGGVEQAISERIVHDVASLESFLERRLLTTGLVTAGLAGAACALAAVPEAVTALRQLDAECDARTPSPAQRAASRAQGRGLLRTARAAWPAVSPTLAWTDLGPRPHHPLVLGCAARAGGVDPASAALVAAYLSVSAPSTAAQRLLALDPVSVAAVTVRLGPAVEAVAAQAAVTLEAGDAPTLLPLTTANRAAEAGKGGLAGATWERSDPGPGPLLDLARLPDDSDPLLDLLAERHAAREERLFAS